jgi:hypothetical protein
MKGFRLTAEIILDKTIDEIVVPYIRENKF